MKAVFIDANILLDLIDKNRTRHLKSKEVLKKLLLDEDTFEGLKVIKELNGIKSMSKQTLIH